MGVVLLQILQWILRIILFLLLLIVVLSAIILIVPIRYRAEGELLEKKPGVRGKITWFFYLIYMKFAYEEELHIVVRVLGFKVYDSGQEPKEEKENQSSERTNASESAINNDVDKSNVSKSTENCTVEKTDSVEKTVATEQTDIKSDRQEQADSMTSELKTEGKEYSLADFEKEIEAEEKAEAKLAEKVIQSQTSSSTNEDDTIIEEEKKSLSEKIEDVRVKIADIIQKIKDIIVKIQDGKLKVEHYLELWNRKETKITFGRAKSKLGKIIIAVLPRKWNITGEIGFDNPCTTGQLLGVIGALYPIIGSNVQIVPDFENEVLSLKGHVKGHIRLINLLHQLVTLVLNGHCFKFIKLVLDELCGSKNSGKQKQGNLKKNKEGDINNGREQF